MNMLIWPRLRIIAQWPLYVLCLLLVGCFSAPKPPGRLSDSPLSFGEGTDVVSALHSMDMLSWIGGLAVLGGIAALVITRGAMGVRALLIGVGLVLLNYAVARYAHWIFIPVLVATAAISLTYAYRIVRRALLKKKHSPQ